MLRTSEEVEYVRDVIKQQGDLMDLYKDLLGPQTFHVITKSRETLHDLADALLSHSASKRTDEAEGYDGLITDVKQMVARAKSLVEIEQHDHRKAILVFTTVTIIFPPLSFVTSFLGMNTQDIRSQKNSQWIFWGTALPLTWVVVLVSMYIGYRIDDFRDSWEKLFNQERQHKALEPQNIDTDEWKSGNWGNKQHERSRTYDTRSTSADDVESGRLR
jgi:CorA-like Mg2+ transporter protein